MHESLQLVSGLPWATAGEASLIATLSARGIKFRLSRLTDQDLTSCDGVGHPIVVVLLLPILGDNDLTDGVGAYLTHLASCAKYRGFAIVVVAHGDRHVSDELVKPDTPFSIKVRHFFGSIGAFVILKTKLDRFTAAALAHEILDIVDATSFGDILELNCIARLLPRAPEWNARKRQLNFYDPYTGRSLLKTTTSAVRKSIACHIQAIAPHILNMTHAGLSDDALPDLEGALHAETIDLGSNIFSWERLMLQLGTCRWLGLAANDLTQVSLSQLPRGLEHLYLHKNAIHEFSARKTDVVKLKSLSLYRNQLANFDWPAGQSTLIRLNLGANPISSLPETLSDCTALEFLGIARTQIASLPEWVFSMRNLRELDISYIENQIPSAQIKHLRARCISIITRPGLVIP